MSANTLVRPRPAPAAPLPAVALPVISGPNDLTIQDAGFILVNAPLGNPASATLPPCASADIGTVFTFIIQANGATFTLDTTGDDVFVGGALDRSTLGDATTTIETAPVNEDGVDQGQLVVSGSSDPGSYVRVEMISSTQWFFTGTLKGFLTLTGASQQAAP